MRLLPLLLFLAFAGPAAAVDIERLVMPGPVIEGHIKEENQCDNCHTRLDKGDQNRLCRDCHQPVDADIRTRRGYHGRLPHADTAECRACHTDHKGRKANIVPLDRETFDHAATDFALKGRHQGVACDSCHASGKKWREAPAECVDCHKEDDSHQGKLGKQCADCHDNGDWRKTRFDHDTKTKFALKDKHAKAACASCHPGQRYKETPKECVACHRINDIHAGRYGDKCADCHTSADWNKPVFNHDKTDFPLRNRHRELRCETCHKGDLYKENKPTDCYSCHRHSDTHRGKNGRKCESCHDTRSWSKVRFDHGKKTKFPLRGGHKELGCESCHRGDVYKAKLKTDCYSCHQGDDRHRGELGKACASCHNETSWSEKVRFDHDLTRFPLIGLHAVAPCEACHLTPVYKDTPRECVRCHEQDDDHRKVLGSDCARCHTPNDWKLWKFNHDRATAFKLTGKHVGLDCHACHTTPVRSGKLVANAQCNACHQKDDVHLGRFGTRCDRCHNSESFTQIQLRH